jgi:hypothetical protein
VSGLEGVRPEVQAFALLMEKRLQQNDYKGGWQNEHVWQLFDRLLEEAEELEELIHSDYADDEREAGIPQEAADVANFAMFIVDRCGCLKAQR